MLAFPYGGQRLSIEAGGQIEREEAFGDAQSGTFLGLHGQLHRGQELIIIRMYPTQLVVEGEHIRFDLLRHGCGLGVVVSEDIDLDGRRNGLVIELAEAHMGFGEIIGIFVVHLLQQVFGGLFRGGVDDELRKVVGWDAGGVGHVETGCGLANEGGHRGDARVGQHHPLQGVADACGGF